MACYESGTVISLANREAITLPDVRGATVRVTKGTLWLTEEHDHHDIVLRAGDNFVIEFDGDTVVEAQNDAVFCVVGNGTKTLKLPQRAHRRNGLLDTLAAFFRAPARPVPYF
jgi:hypothetical protein